MRRVERCRTGLRPASRFLSRLQKGRPSLIALTLIVVVTSLLWQRQRVQPLTAFDQPFYLGIAADLLDHARFTDGFMFAAPGPDGLRASGMRFAPLYPLLVAGAAAVDPSLRHGVECMVASSGHDTECPRAAPSLRALQFAELAMVLWLIWWMGGQVGGTAIGWLSLLVACGAVPLLLRSVAYLMTEMTSLALATCAMAACLQTLRHVAPTVEAACLAPGNHAALVDKAGAGPEQIPQTPETARGAQTAWAALAGVLLGLATLTRPAFLYLIPTALLAAVLAALAGRRRAGQPRPRPRAARPPAAALLAVLALAASFTLAPWLLRNAVVLGRPALTHGYDSHTLVQRIAFDTMTWREYGRAYVCWLPDGTGLGRLFAGPHACDRFGWDDQPSSFYVLGLRHMLPETLQAAGGYDHHLGYLVSHYLLRMPVWHALVSIPLALRGAYVAHWWGFVLLWPALAWSWAARPWAVRRNDAFWRPGLLLLACPAWFMLAFNAAVAVNQVRYNLLLIPLYAVSGALAVRWLAVRAVALRASAMRAGAVPA